MFVWRQSGLEILLSSIIVEFTQLGFLFVFSFWGGGGISTLVKGVSARCFYVWAGFIMYWTGFLYGFFFTPILSLYISRRNFKTKIFRVKLT